MNTPKHIGVLLVFSFCSLLFIAQNKTKTDSLTRLLIPLKPTKDRINLLCKLSEEYEHTDLSRCKSYAQQALKLADSLNYPEGRVISLNRLAAALESEGNYKNSIEYLLKALPLAEELPDKEHLSTLYNTMGLNYSGLFNHGKAIESFKKSITAAETSDKKTLHAIPLCNMGNAFVQKGLYDSSTVCFLKAAFVFDKAGLRDESATCLYNLGNIYYRISNYEKALSYYRKCMGIFETLNNKKRIAECLQGIGSVYYNQKKFQNAFDHFFRALTIKKEIGDKKGIVANLINIGVSYSGIDEYDNAIIYLNRADSINSELSDMNNKLAILNNTGYAFLNTGKYKEALSKFKTYHLLATKLRSKDDIRIAAYNLSVIYSQLKDYERAFDFYKLYAAMNDSILSAETKTRIAELVFNNELQEKELQLNTLRSESKIKELELEKSRFKNFILIVVILLFLLLTTFFFIQYRNSQNRRVEKEKILMQDNILRAVVETKEREQKRVAEELHDSLGQILSTLKLRLSAMREGNDRSHLDVSLDLINQASLEVKTISHDLMPNVLTELGLKKALAQLSSSINDGGAIKLEIFTEALDDALPELANILVYRITQELVNNILKHAQASHATIRFVRRDRCFEIVAEDNGRGFSNDDLANKNGLGWKTMLSRIMMLNGSYQIEQRPQGGTCIKIALEI